MDDYGALDRVLHRLALGFAPVAEMSFDLDQSRAKPDTAAVKSGRHVFVSGLARAGTTILMRRIYGTGEFCSLTYRHMPFVLAPNLWGRIAAGRTAAQPKERAHGDRILVSVDSPESLDEVFWRIHDGGSYIRREHLAAHRPDAEVAGKFAAYIGAVLKADPEGRTRYLSKNNNNILRLSALRSLLPEAVILVPFRDPLTHAQSLMKQHANFLAQQQANPFVRSYMTWLGHHEFGLDHRPFRFSPDGAAALAALDPGTVPYWLEVWRQTYGWLEGSAPEDAVFVCYEDLCQDPAVWPRIAALCGTDPGTETEEPFSISAAEPDGAVPGELLEDTRAIYDRLCARSRSALADPPEAFRATGAESVATFARG